MNFKYWSAYLEIKELRNLIGSSYLCSVVDFKLKHRGFVFDIV